MHNIYNDEGKYNFVYQISNILYSTLFSNIINTLLEYLSLSEDSIIKTRKKSKKTNKITIIPVFISTLNIQPKHIQILQQGRPSKLCGMVSR